jgi:hypothetical protein
MNRACLVTALLVYLLISFVPQLAVTNLLGKGRKGGGG